MDSENKHKDTDEIDEEMMMRIIAKYGLEQLYLTKLHSKDIQDLSNNVTSGNQSTLQELIANRHSRLEYFATMTTESQIACINFSIKLEHIIQAGIEARAMLMSEDLLRYAISISSSGVLREFIAIFCKKNDLELPQERYLERMQEFRPLR